MGFLDSLVLGASPVGGSGDYKRSLSALARVAKDLHNDVDTVSQSRCTDFKVKLCEVEPEWF